MIGGIGSALYLLLRGASDQPDNLPDDEYRRLMEVQDRTGYDTGVRPRRSPCGARIVCRYPGCGCKS